MKNIISILNNKTTKFIYFNQGFECPQTFSDELVKV